MVVGGLTSPVGLAGNTLSLLPTQTTMRVCTHMWLRMVSAMVFSQKAMARERPSEVVHEGICLAKACRPGWHGG